MPLQSEDSMTVKEPKEPIPVTAPSNAWVCGRSLSQMAGWNPAKGMDVCLLWMLCVVRYRSLRRADHSSTGVLPSVISLSVLSEPQQWGGPGLLGLWSHGKKKRKKKKLSAANKHVQLWSVTIRSVEYSNFSCTKSNDNRFTVSCLHSAPRECWNM